MNIKNIFSKLSIKRECKKYSVPLNKCPEFLFVIMGMVVIIAILASYFIAVFYGVEPEIQALIALFTAMITFTIGHFIVRSFVEFAEINNLKSQFLNIISHELLTPLSSIKWSLSILYAKNIHLSQSETDELLCMANQSTEKMIDIINSLLDISRLETGKIKLHLKEVDLVNIVNEVIKNKEADASAKNANIKFYYDGNIPKVKTDPKRIRIVINNLIDNAIKFSKSNSDILVKLKKSLHDVIFSVEDFGVGIPKNQKKHVYSKFFKADNEFRYQTKGFGLGLFTAKFLLDALGGKMDFVSKENQGSLFWFIIPINKDN